MKELLERTKKIYEELNPRERELVIQILANVDDIVKELTEEQRKKLERCLNRIYGNCRNLLDGVR